MLIPSLRIKSPIPGGPSGNVEKSRRKKENLVFSVLDGSFDSIPEKVGFFRPSLEACKTKAQRFRAGARW
jgi:hypothetical protein